LYRPGSGSKPCTPVVHIKIAGKWMFIPLKMVLIGIDPYPPNYFEIEPVPSCNQTWQNAHPPFTLYSSIMFEDTHGTPVEITQLNVMLSSYLNNSIVIYSI
jgi:hypothetical protein